MCFFVYKHLTLLIVLSAAEVKSEDQSDDDEAFDTGAYDAEEFANINEFLKPAAADVLASKTMKKGQVPSNNPADEKSPEAAIKQQKKKRYVV